MWFAVVIDDKPVKYFSYLKCAFNLAKKETLKNKKKVFIYDKNNNLVGYTRCKRNGFCIYWSVKNV